jgi:hypothetical protein
VEKLANSANFGCQTLIVRDKYGAICASDAGKRKIFFMKMKIIKIYY